MGFSLLENPFAVLGLGTDATPSQITARARELGGELASGAGRALISPRTRLQAEVAFLPGMSEEEVQTCLSTLASGRAPEFSKATPLIQANILAYLASSGRATATNLEFLAKTATSIREDALVILNRCRQTATMPPIPQPMFDSAMEQLESQHAEALSDGARALKNGADVLSGIAESLGQSVTGASVFLRQTMAAWERATASDDNKDRERAQELETKLKTAPDNASVAELSGLIHTIAARSRPSRTLAFHFGLPHEASAKIVDSWRSLAVDLVNEHKALNQAATILESLAKEFGTSDEPGQRVARDLAICRKRIDSGEDTPELRRFTAALEAAERDAAKFKWEILSQMDGDRRSRYNTSAVVDEFWDSFVDAAKNAASDLPWKGLRAFAVRLHNDFSESESALALTDLALQHAYGNSVADDVRPQLEADRRFLLRHVLQKQLNAAAEKKQRGVVRKLLSKLIPLADSDAERREYTSTLRNLQWQAIKLFFSRAFYAAFAIFIVYAIANDNGGKSRTSSPAYSNYTPATTYTPPTTTSNTTGITNNFDDGAEVHPPPGTSVLSRAQLRWCTFQDARLTGGHAYLESIRDGQYTSLDAFNRAIAAFNASINDFNASCSQYRYNKADKGVVDAELSMKAATLQAEGQRIAAASYMPQPSFPAPTAAPAAPAPAYAPPGYSNPGRGTYQPPPSQAPGPAPSVPVYSAAYVDGQQDRRAWEAWFASLSGDFRQGADWWAGIRSTQNPLPCNRVQGVDRPAAVQGCTEAKARLASSDRRRRAEPDYRAGWNNP